MTSLNLFPPDRTLPVSISASWPESRVGILLGFTWSPADEFQAIIVGEVGQVLRLAPHEFTIDWHYDHEHDQWSLVGMSPVDETDQGS